MAAASSGTTVGMAVGTGVCVADGVAVLSLLQPVSMDSIKVPAKAAEIMRIFLLILFPPVCPISLRTDLPIQPIQLC